MSPLKGRWPESKGAAWMRMHGNIENAVNGAVRINGSLSIYIEFLYVGFEIKKKGMTTHVFRLSPGQDLRKEIQAFAEANGIAAGWIITAVGSLRVANIRFANQSRGSRQEGSFEIVSVVGTVSIHGSHLHICLSDETGTTIGGHLLEDNIINTTAEIVIGKSKNLIFTRETDKSTSFRELVVRNR